MTYDMFYWLYIFCLELGCSRSSIEYTQVNESLYLIVYILSPYSHVWYLCSKYFAFQDNILCQSKAIPQVKNEAAEMLGIWLPLNYNNKKIISVLKAAAIKQDGKAHRRNSSRQEAWIAPINNFWQSLNIRYQHVPYQNLNARALCNPLSELLYLNVVSQPQYLHTYVIIHHNPVVQISFHRSIIWQLLEYPYQNSSSGIHHQGKLSIMCALKRWYQILDCMGYYEKLCGNYSWVFATLEYNYSHGITISVDHGAIKGKKSRDCSIMSKAREMNSLVTGLRSINRIRSSFQVNSLNEICSANGKDIDNQFYLNKRCWSVRNTFERRAK